MDYVTTLIGHRERLAALEEHARQRRDGKDGQIIVQTDDASVRALKEEIAQLKAQALTPKNDSEAIPLAIGRMGEELQNIKKELDFARVEIAERLADLYREIEELKKNPAEVVAAEPAELQDEIKNIATVAETIGSAALRGFSEQQREIEALKETTRRLDLQLATFFAHIERPA